MTRYSWKLAGLSAAFFGGSLFGLNISRNLEATSISAASPVNSNRPSAIMKFGFPVSHASIKIRKNYILSYDNRLRNATWVFEHLNKDLLNKRNSDRANSRFTEDDSINGMFRARNIDYYRSGYDRGHIAAASNHRAHQDWMDETFFLSNVIPQDSNLNQYAWNRLEKYVRKLVKIYDNVYICTGPLYLPKPDENGRLHVTYQVIGPGHIAVPTHLFKVVVCEKENHLEMLSYIVPNQPVDHDKHPNEFLQPIEKIEEASGIIFFDRLSKEAFVKINHRYIKRG